MGTDIRFIVPTAGTPSFLSESSLVVRPVVGALSLAGETGDLVQTSWTETTFTVDWADLDANSPYTHTYYANIVAGDKCRFEALTTPSKHLMTMTGTGKFNMDPVSLVIETFDQQIYDLSLNTYLPVSTVTIHP